LAIDTASAGLYDDSEKGFFKLPYPSLNPASTGKTLLVWGGSSSVGALAIQLATASGVRVVSVASKHNIDFVKSLGASEVLDYNNSSVVDDVVEAVKSAGGDFIGTYDAISTEDSFKVVFPITEKLGGGNVALTLPGPEKGVPSNVKLGNVFGVNPITHPVWKDYVTSALEQGKLKAVPEAMVVGKGLENVQKGLDTLKAGVSAKKVVVEL
jgi:NADPH:quinone reductase-like Zn-dependent oxidoreductase